MSGERLGGMMERRIEGKYKVAERVWHEKAEHGNERRNRKG